MILKKQALSLLFQLGEPYTRVLYETNVYYAERVLGNKYTLEKLIEAEPTLKDKILSFFKGASTDYADVPKLAGAANKYNNTYVEQVNGDGMKI